MRITKEDSGLMVVKERNIFAFVVTVIFIFLGFNIIFNPSIFTSETPPLWFGLVSFFLGLIFLFTIKITTIKLDKSENKISISKKRIVGGQIKEEYYIDNIKEIEFAVDFSSSDGKNAYSYQLFFVLNNGQNIELSQSKTSSSSATFPSEVRLGKRIASFLCVPLQERRPPTVVVSKAIKKSITRK